MVEAIFSGREMLSQWETQSKLTQNLPFR